MRERSRLILVLTTLWVCVTGLCFIYFGYSSTDFNFYSKFTLADSSVDKTSSNTVLDISNLIQTDPRVISYAKSVILPPPELPYAFGNVGPTGIVLAAWPALHKMAPKGGIFVEAGAYDGVAASNTVWLERSMNWTGLLVECHPKSLESLKAKHRRAYIAPVCLSTSTHAESATMTSVDEWNPSSSLGSGNIFENFKNFSQINVQTIPLYTLLAAIDIKVVDFISLDIQSLELKVIQNFPFELIFVKSWLIEVDLLSEGDKTKLINTMNANGFIMASKITHGDYFFLHESFQ